MAAAGSTTFFTYKFTRDSEQFAFDEAFEGVAAKLAPGLVAEINLRVSHSSNALQSVILTKPDEYTKTCELTSSLRFFHH